MSTPIVNFPTPSSPVVSNTTRGPSGPGAASTPGIAQGPDSAAGRAPAGSSLPELAVDRQLCFLLHRCGSRLISGWNRYLRQHNLNYTEYVVLLAAWECAPVSEHALALRLELDAYTLEDALTHLERNRFLERSGGMSAEDDRIVSNTQQGLQMQPALREMRSKMICDLGLSPTDASVLVSQLQKLTLSLADIDLERQDCAALTP